MIRSRSYIFLLAFLVEGIVLFFHGQASAQTGAEKVIMLSDSGFEQAHSVAFSPDGKLLAVGGTSGIYLVDVEKVARSGFIETGTWARSVAFRPGSQILAAGLFDNTIQLWKVPDGQPLQKLDDPRGWVRSISFSADGSLITSASDDDTVRVWRAQDSTSVLVLKNMTGVRAVALSPDGALLAVALGDKTVRVWEVATGNPVYTLRGHEDWPRCLAFSPDGKLLASGGFDKTIRIWDMSNGGLKQTLKGHSSSVLGIAFSPDGNTLASGSVDQTVRLWNVEDGRPMRVLQGHTGFVYSVAFSPDGQVLASSGADNTVRLWDMNTFGKADTEELPAVITPSDCRACHHPHGQSEPPRVIELRCEGCHPNGASLEWCPGFSRSEEAVTPPVSFTTYPGLSGVPVVGSDISVLIATPSNGETLYAGDGLTAAAFVVGQVSTHKTTLSEVQVQLDVLSKGQKTATLTTVPSPTGQFKFNLSINPRGVIPYTIKPGGADCVPCHEDFRGQAPLPNGDVQLVVTVRSPGGRQASDERWIKVDASSATSLPVQVIDATSKQPLPGIPVEALAVLYEWRARYGHAAAQPDGTAHLQLNQLTQYATSYHLSVPPTVYRGELFVGDQPVTVVLQPGEEVPQNVVMTVHAQSGQINGQFSRSDTPGGVKIWAVQLPYGPAYQTTANPDNQFTFDRIPVSQYAILPDPDSLAGQNLSSAPSVIDLLESPISEISLSLQKGRMVSGEVRSEEGDTLPFAWVRIANDESVQAIDPTTGRFLLKNLPDDAKFVTVTAPGYYSLLHSVDKSTRTIDTQLVRRPDLRLVPWGNGQVYLPAETSATMEELNLVMKYGWVWGRNATSEPLTIHLPGADVRISSGQFALEQPTEGTGWLYLQDGEAEVAFDDSPDVLPVRGGEMTALSSGAAPFQMESAIAIALHPSLDQLPVFEKTEPTLNARIQNWLVRTGIGAMQTITFITYILSLVTLITIPVVVLFSYLKKKRG